MVHIFSVSSKGKAFTSHLFAHRHSVAKPVGTSTVQLHLLSSAGNARHLDRMEAVQTEGLKNPYQMGCKK